MPIRAVLFDLDGTLADTGPDLAYALNCVLQEQGRPPVDYGRIRGQVSHGALAMVLAGFGLHPGDPAAEGLRRRMVEIYSQNLVLHTRLFPGVESLLEQLEQAGLCWGIVTNKPAWLTDPLALQLGLAARAACVVSGDTLPERKPHPAPVLHACELLGCAPPQCVFVGDAQKDIEAGQRAGTRAAVALFGYVDEADRPQDWGADWLLQEPLELLQRLELR
jgi:phosphoglycolate phosphatase